MNALENIAKTAALKLKLTNLEEIYRGYYYAHNYMRNKIFSCKYKGKDAVLKVYDDPRDTCEGVALMHFNRYNTSKILKAPEIFGYQKMSSTKGWLLVEKLPSGTFFSSPLASKKRHQFIDLFLEYRKHFPHIPHQSLTMVDKLRADAFHLFRINRWFELAHHRENIQMMEGQKPILNLKEFLPLFYTTIEIIQKEFKNRRMLYCHGHFKPQELFEADNGKFYLIDFAHAKLYPEGYELAHMAWADHLMGADWSFPYEKWVRGMFEWEELLIALAKRLKFRKAERLIRTSFIERIIGTILADVTASDRPPEEKKKRLELLLKLLKYDLGTL